MGRRDEHCGLFLLPHPSFLVARVDVTKKRPDLDRHHVAGSLANDLRLGPEDTLRVADATPCRA